MGVRVIKKRKNGEQAKLGESIVYIGRPNVLGNPFAMTNESMRSSVVEKYRIWLRCEWVNKRAAYHELKALATRVKQGENIALQCWCAPCACHGDVIKDAIEKINDWK